MYKASIMFLVLFSSLAFAFNELPTYHGQEFYHNFTNAAVISRNYGTFFYLCGSDSMSPTFDCADTLIITRTFGNAQVGDIIVASIQDKSLWSMTADYLFHRVIDIGYDKKGKYYITKGDNNDYIDPILTRRYNFNWKITGKWIR